MSRSSAERIARRLAERQQALSTKSMQNAASRAVLSMAKQYATSPSRLLDVSGLLASPGFDEAFMMAAPRIILTIPSFDLQSFRAKLAREASSSRFVGELSGNKVDGEADLFAVVLRGDLSSMEELVQDTERFAAFGRVLKAAKIADPRSSVVMCPHLIDVSTAGDIFPGQLRKLLELLQLPLHDPEFPMTRALADLVPFRPIVEEQRSIAVRVLVGVRVRILRTGQAIEDDRLSAGSIDSEDDRAAGDWQHASSAALPSGVDALFPTSWCRACSRMAADELLSDLVLRAGACGMDMSGRFDAIHLCETEDMLHVSATRGPLSVGPSTTSASAAYADSRWFADFIVSLADSVYEKSHRGLLPQG